MLLVHLCSIEEKENHGNFAHVRLLFPILQFTDKKEKPIFSHFLQFSQELPRKIKPRKDLSVD
jgi:hypothetical protein